MSEHTDHRGSAPSSPSRSRRFRNYLWRKINNVENWAATSDNRRVRFAAYVLRLSAQVVRQWARDRCPQQAASLAFQTVLSVVPVLAVCLAVFRATGNFDAQSALVHFLSNNLIPVSPDEIASQLHGWTENITFESLGMVGLISILILAFIMYNNLDRVLNYIWRVERKRPLTQKFAVFYATATIGPFLIGVSIYQAAKVGLTQGFAGYFVSFSTSFAAVWLANFFLPATKVKFRAAAFGALVTTVLFEGAKNYFAFYVANFAFSKYSGIYGAVWSVPLLLIWIYWSWLMFLLGVEVAHATQNIQFLERIDRRRQLSLENELLQRVNGPVAARVMVEVARAYISGEKVLSRSSIADRFDLSDEVVERIANRLKDADLLMEVEGDQVGFVPARPPQEISLDAVLAAFRGDDTDLAGTRGGSPLEEILREIEAETRGKTRALTLEQLART